MEFQIGFNIAIGLASFLGGWVLNNIRESMRDLQAADLSLADKVSKIEVLVAGQYVTRNEMEKALAIINGKLDRLIEKR